jgi:hypothetical protein
VNVHLLDFLSQQENFHIKNDRHPYCCARRGRGRFRPHAWPTDTMPQCWRLARAGTLHAASLLLARGLGEAGGDEEGAVMQARELGRELRRGLLCAAAGSLLVGGAAGGAGRASEQQLSTGLTAALVWALALCRTARLWRRGAPATEPEQGGGQRREGAEREMEMGERPAKLGAWLLPLVLVLVPSTATCLACVARSEVAATTAAVYGVLQLWLAGVVAGWLACGTASPPASPVSAVAAEHTHTPPGRTIWLQLGVAIYELACLTTLVGLPVSRIVLLGEARLGGSGLVMLLAPLTLWLSLWRGGITDDATASAGLHLWCLPLLRQLSGTLRACDDDGEGGASCDFGQLQMLRVALSFTALAMLVPPALCLAGRSLRTQALVLFDAQVVVVSRGGKTLLALAAGLLTRSPARDLPPRQGEQEPHRSGSQWAMVGLGLAVLCVLVRVRLRRPFNTPCGKPGFRWLTLPSDFLQLNRLSFDGATAAIGISTVAALLGNDVHRTPLEIVVVGCAVVGTLLEAALRQRKGQGWRQIEMSTSSLSSSSSTPDAAVGANDGELVPPPRHN